MYQRKLGSAVTPSTAYGQGTYRRSRHMGDLFNDIMGGVLGDTWTARPDWMKNIKLNVNDTLNFLEQSSPELAGVAQQTRTILQTQGEQAAQSYLQSQTRSAMTNPIVWIGGGILLLIIVGQMLPRKR